MCSIATGGANSLVSGFAISLLIFTGAFDLLKER